MLLTDYIKTIPYGKRRPTIQKIATYLGICESYVTGMANGRRKILEKYAVPLEKVTDGIVRRQDTAPHMYE